MSTPQRYRATAVLSHGIARIPHLALNLSQSRSNGSLH